MSKVVYAWKSGRTAMEKRVTLSRCTALNYISLVAAVAAPAAAWPAEWAQEWVARKKLTLSVRLPVSPSAVSPTSATTTSRSDIDRSHDRNAWIDYLGNIASFNRALAILA